MSTIEWHEALQQNEAFKKKSIERFSYLMEELKQSSPTMLTANDFHYYSEELTYHSPDNKVYSANDCRRICLDNSDCDIFDVLESFQDDDTDDIIDFY